MLRGAYCAESELRRSLSADVVSGGRVPHSHIYPGEPNEGWKIVRYQSNRRGREAVCHGAGAIKAAAEGFMIADLKPSGGNAAAQVDAVPCRGRQYEVR